MNRPSYCQTVLIGRAWLQLLAWAYILMSKIFPRRWGELEIQLGHLSVQSSERPGRFHRHAQNHEKTELETGVTIVAHTAAAFPTETSLG